MNEFHDPDLGRRLRAGAGADPDLAVAQQTVHRRVARARRRRVAAVSGTAVLLLVSFGVVAAVGNNDTTNHLISTADSDSLLDNDDQITSTVTAEPTTSIDDSPDVGRTTSSMAVDDTTSVPSSVADAATTSPPTEAPTTPVLSSGSSGSTGTTKPKAPPTPTSTTSAPTTATPQAAPTAPGVDETKNFLSTGGSITVRLSGGQLSLVGAPGPAAGFTVDEQHVSATEVEVRFQSAGHRSKITVEIRSGRLVGNVEEDNTSSGSEENTGSGRDSGSSSTSEVPGDD
jgi:hypothetical protein